MLDLKTTMVALLCTAATQSLIWVAIWLTWRQLHVLKFMAAGFGMIALATLMMMMRGPTPPAWHILADNFLLKAGIVAIFIGQARFLGRSVMDFYGPALLALFMAAFVVALAIAPGDVSPRIHLSTAFTLLLLGMLAVILIRDTRHPAVLRWITVGVLAEYALATLYNSAVEISAPASGAAIEVLTNRNAWVFLHGSVFITGLFASFLFMIGGRLTLDLMTKNVELSREVERRRKLESELAVSLAAEKAAREEQKQFLSVVGHEFRTPLAIIQRSAEMAGVQVGASSPKISQRLEHIEGAVRRLFTLLDQFLALDRFEAGVIQPEQIDVADLLREAKLHFERVGGAKRIEMNVAPDLPAYSGDPSMLLTVVINLVDNALKYSPDDSPVTIGARAEDMSITISVQDRGEGIPEPYRDKIGGRFFRAPNVAPRPGTGLGLYNSRRMLSVHGGELTLLHANDAGLTAQVRLPLPGIGPDRSESASNGIMESA